MSEKQAAYGNNPFSDLDQFDAINFETNTYDAQTEEIKQRTVKWFLNRWDKFTGSRIPDLMKQGRGKGETWGETAKAVILEIASYQMMTEEGREQYAIEQMYKDFRQTRWGNTYEPEARAKYAEHTGYNIAECSFRVHPEIPYFGGSFDGEVVGFMIDERLDVGTNGIIEIKCPYDPIKHMKNRNLSVDGINSSFEHYGQIQANIEVAGVDWCDFISYDPRCKPEFQMVIIRVNRDQIFIDAMLERIHEAKRILDGFLAGKTMEEMTR